MKPRRKFILLEVETTLSKLHLHNVVMNSRREDTRILQCHVNAARPEKAKRNRKKQ